ncbi:MAG: tRNA dihydrouridine synthase DusB [Proteobacteria bacterium]|nr:tRNA dihydrouridine synthase DusB [Pseudomonadota bacterium]MBU1742090.1 tRNA dihydrouridine synthase DusB [Pseudomonadota bacterium]
MLVGPIHIDPPFIPAPMAGISNPPFRRLCAEQGVPLAYSEMVSAEGLIRREKKGLALLARIPGEAPLCVQLFGARPAAMAEAARIVTDHAAAAVVDVNLGCPAKKVVKSGAGAALMRRPALAGEVIAAVRRNTTLPLTVKIRSGWNSASPNARQIALIAREEGADAIIVHGRYAKQGFTGQADWDVIADVKSGLNIPVVGNGDVTTPRDAVEMIRRTGCDAVMIGRAARGNPWIFSQAADLWAGKEVRAVSPTERRRAALAHARLLAEHVGSKRAVFMLRAVLGWYVKGLPGATAFRQAINTSLSLEWTLAAAEAFFAASARGHDAVDLAKVVSGP